MTLLAYFVVAAVPLGLLALVSAWVATSFNNGIQLGRNRGREPLKWWQPGAGILFLAGFAGVMLAAILGVGAATVWALRTLGWIA